LTQYTEKHPDVVATKKQIEDIKAQQDQMLNDWKDRIEDRKQKLTRLTDPRLLTLRTNISMVEGDMDRQAVCWKRPTNRSPTSTCASTLFRAQKWELGALDRDYSDEENRITTTYCWNSRKLLSAPTPREEQQGGGIQVSRFPPTLPEKPVAPKRLVLTVGGFGIGFGLGILLVLIVEIRRLFTIQTVDDAKHYTTLPVLASNT
jgi:hypothetical protein